MIREKQQLCQQLLKAFDKLNQHDRLLLVFLAAFGEKIHIDNLNQLLRRYQKNPQLSALGLGSLKLTADNRTALAKKGLLHGGKKTIFVPNVIRQALCLLSHEQGWFQPLLASFDLGYSSYIGNRTRQIRAWLLLADFTAVAQYLELPKDPQLFSVSTLAPLVTVCFEPFDSAFFATLPANLQYYAFAGYIAQLRAESIDTDEVTALLADLVKQGMGDEYLRCLLAEQYMFGAQSSKALQLDIGNSHYALALQAWHAFEQGELETALSLFQQSVKVRYQHTRTRGQHVNRLPGLFYLLILLKMAVDSESAHFVTFDKAISHLSKLSYNLYLEIDTYRELMSFAKSQQAMENEYRPMPLSQSHHQPQQLPHQLALLIDLLCLHWSGLQPTDDKLDMLAQSFECAVQGQNLWYAKLAAQIIQHYGHNDQAADFLKTHPPQGLDLLQLMRKKERWQQGLEQLIALKRPSTASDTEQQTRLIWWIDVRNWPYDITAGIQKKGKKNWLKPSALPLKQLLEQRSTLDCITMEDEKLLQLLKRIESTNKYRSNTLRFSGAEAIQAIMGHPSVFKTGDNKTPVTIVEQSPQVQISESGSGFKLSMPALAQIEAIGDDTPFVEAEDIDFLLAEQGNNQFTLIHLDPVHAQIAKVIGSEGLRAPLSAKSQVIESIRAIAPFLNIQSDISDINKVDMGMNELDPDLTLYLNIHNIGPGFQIQLKVQPLGLNGPTLTPGAGKPMIVEKIDGVRTVTNRLLEQEKQQVQKLIDCCPMFANMIEHKLQLDELEESLECLEQLYQMQAQKSDPQIVLQWQKGQPIRVSNTLSTSQMTVKTDKKQDWFSLKGQLKVSKDEVMELKQVLDAMEKTDSRFIPVGDDTYLALTAELRRQMQMLASVTYRDKFHPLAIPLVEQATQGMIFECDQDFKQTMNKVEAAFGLTPALPSTLQAQLRDYQKEGFDWAIRLAYWGAGACLADDMGLGKTLQALAVILHRAPQGPTLVISPTSVCFNWLGETQRFAPTLNPVIFGQLDKDARKTVLKNAKPFDLIICSYGLLQSEIEKLHPVKWQTIVADEAQALKNAKAKRTIAACSLQGEFRLITTGTPIENNLTELWSLFNFINPGLLGSSEAFNKAFISKIESFDTKAYIRKAANQALKRRIAPFVLRRLKTEVLTELPARTEITVHVEPSFEEVAFYEALRQKAVETLLEKKKDEKPQQKRLRILAELMKLRRACCHPSLVPGGEKFSSAKLNRFELLIEELIANNHKALVFSQFVGHLSILRELLIRKGIHFEYLDGSTPNGQREKAVNAFQAGKADLFLISLKAGGFGLNLTAADYVIHMDPWWNPAVEDQASDRAHRLGQTRPVTIYRLICQNTIEQKILDLHQRKRELAQNLLTDSDGGGSLSVEELMALMTPAQQI